MTRIHRRLCIAAAVVVGLAVLILVGSRLAVRQLQSRIEGALGPRASIGAISAHWSGIEVLDLRIRAAPGWPAKDELRAARVQMTPDLRSLLGRPWRIARVTVEDGYLSALRSRDGRLHLVPALLGSPKTGRESAAPDAAGGATSLVIGQVKLVNATLAIFDASVRQPPLPLRLERLDAEAGPFVLPALDQAITIKLAGLFKGPQRDGRVAIDGRYTPLSSDASLSVRFSGVDLVALQPYLLRMAEARVRRGTLDLELRATVLRRHLHAPGKVTLTNLELANDGGLATFAGIPRAAVLAAMSQKGRLEVKFTLDGRLDDPSFSLNENVATRIASGLAEGLGVSLSGVVKGLGSVVKGLFGR